MMTRLKIKKQKSLMQESSGKGFRILDQAFSLSGILI